MNKAKKIAILAIIAMVLTMMPAAMFAADSDRLAGTGRVETALAIADAGWETADTVVLAPADQANLVDALAAAPLAGQEDAPILLTFKGALNAKVADKIEELGASTVYVIGAISHDVLADVKAIDGVEKAEHLTGANRWATADAINAKLVDPAGSFIVGYNAIPDALSVASYAAANGYAIVLTKADGSVDASKLVGDETYLVGGTGVVKAYADTERISGTDRFATNADVADKLDFDYAKVYVANGISLVDALAVAPLAAKDNAFVLLSSANDVKPVDGITASTQVIAVGGVGVVPASVVSKVVPVSDELEVVSVSATNLKEVVVKFNKAIDEDTVVAANFDISDFSTETAKLQADEKTVVVTLGTQEDDTVDVFVNDDEYTITIEDVEDLSGNAIAKTEETFKVNDYALPELVSVEFTGPQTAKLTFSEPVDPTVIGSVTVDNGVYSASFTEDDFSGKSLTVDLGTELDEGTHSFKVKDFADYVPYTMIAKTMDVTYKAITDAPEVTVKEASQTKVTLKFDRPVKGLEVESFYHTYSSWKPLSIEDKNGAAVNAGEFYDEVTLKFTDSDDLTVDRPLLEGKVKLVVLAENSNDTVIEDRWENELDGDVTLYVNISADNTPPTVKNIKVNDDQRTVKLYFSEEVTAASAENKDNTSITNPDGDVVKTYDYTRTLKQDGDDYYLEIVFDDVQDEGSYTIELVNIKDVSLAGNKMASTTKTFVVSDKTGISLENDVTVTAVDADDILYVDYGTEMATSGTYSVLDIDNYLWNGASIDGDDVIISMFTSKIVKIEFKDATNLVGGALTIGRVADSKGNLSDELAFEHEGIAEEQGPEITKVTKVADNKLELTINKELKSVKTAGIEVDGNGDGTFAAVAAISFVNDGDDTIIKVTLPSGEKSTGTAGLINDTVADPDVIAKVKTVAGNIKSVTGAYMGNATYGPADITFKDGVAPKVSKISGGDFDGEYKVYVLDASGDDDLIDTLKIVYSEDIDGNSVSKYTYSVGGYKVTNVTVTDNVVTLTIENNDNDVTDDLEATPTVTQQYSIEDSAGNTFTAGSIEALSVADASAAGLS